MKIVNKKKFARFIIIVVAAVLCVGFLANDKCEIVGYDTYKVTQGDTLWDIAKLSNGYGHIEHQRIVYDMQQASGLATADIQIWDTIQIPIYEEE